MIRTLDINPLTRIEGHAKVHIELGDDGQVSAATMHVLEFRGFERFVQGMQVEMMPTITSRICGTCPHAHHLVAAKCVDNVFSVTPPRAAVLLRELLNCGSILHSHAIHFFALAGPDLFLGIGSAVARRNLVGLLSVAPDLAKKALRLRSIGQHIAEAVGGRGTHPVTAVAGGMASALTKEVHQSLRNLADEALVLTKVALGEGKAALLKNEALLSMLPLSVHDLGTVKNGKLDLYDGQLRLKEPDGAVALEFEAESYADHMVEEALPHSYGKQILLKTPKAQGIIYRVGPLARLNCADAIDTPLANAELASFKKVYGNPCHQIVLGHYARLIEMVYAAEKAVEILADPESASPNVRTQPSGTPHRAVAHVEAPRGR